MEIGCQRGSSAAANRMTSVTRRMLGRGGKTNSFWAWYSFKMSFWIVPESAARSTPVLSATLDIHGHDHRGGRVDRHGGAHGTQVDAREQRLHVGQRVDGDAGPAHLSLGQGIVGVTSQQGGHVERRRQAVAPGAEQLLEAAVGVLGGPEAGELAHRPQPRAVHGGVRSTRVGKLAGQLGVVRAVDGLEREARHGLELRLALG